MKIKNDKLFIQIACLIVSVGLWVMVMVQTTDPLEDTITNVPVTIRNLASLEKSNLVLMNSDKDNLTVNIKVKGYGKELAKFSRSDFSAYIDVLGFGEGTKYADVVITGPNGIEIVSNYPERVACVVESVISKVMDVTIQYDGNQSADYYRGYGTSNPSSVKVTGPRSIVDSAKLAIATINVDGAQETVVKTIPVRIYDGTDTEIFMSVPTGNVEVTVPVYPTKYVSLRPNIVGEPLEGYEVVNVTMKPDKVKVAARKDILDTVKELTVAELDITGASHNILASKEIINDDGLMILDLSAEPVVSAVIEKIIQKELVYKLDEIEYINVPEGYEVYLTDAEAEITVILEDAESRVKNIGKDDLRLVADLSEGIFGTNQVKIVSETEDEIKNINLSNDMIEVNLVESQESPDSTDETEPDKEAE